MIFKHASNQRGFRAERMITFMGTRTGLAERHRGRYQACADGGAICRFKTSARHLVQRASHQILDLVKFIFIVQLPSDTPNLVRCILKGHNSCDDDHLMWI